MQIIELKESITASNDRDAEEIRNKLKNSGTFLINLMSSPGSGKTTLLSRTIIDLSNELKIGVIEADIDSSVDAERIEALGAKAVQVHTDGMCHMDAGMTLTGLEALDYSNLDLVFLENVGNLICPAEFDTGSSKNVMILSVPEGDDKPLKYPLMFSVSDVVLITKTDALPFFNFDTEKCASRIHRLNPKAHIIQVSAKTGENMDLWYEWIKKEIDNWK